jgi:hypothetical protein
MRTPFDIHVAFDLNIAFELAGNAQVGITFDLSLDRYPGSKYGFATILGDVFTRRMARRYRSDGRGMLDMRLLTVIFLSGLIPKGHRTSLMFDDSRR